MFPYNYVVNYALVAPSQKLSKVSGESKFLFFLSSVFKKMNKNYQKTTTVVCDRFAKLVFSVVSSLHLLIERPIKNHVRFTRFCEKKIRCFL